MLTSLGNLWFNVGDVGKSGEPLQDNGSRSLTCVPDFTPGPHTSGGQVGAAPTEVRVQHARHADGFG